MESLEMMPARVRITSILKKALLAGEYKSGHMPGSQLILANMLHVSRSSLNQELKLMQKDGYFKVRGREMYELDEEKLNALL